ncbi:MAG: peptidoglycan-binding protein, partial [Solobacterium sp.]|nr:peptidoglycan-binding protein [Solobacterium sp.]
LPGDIIHAVNGTVVDGMDSSEIKELVQGEEGTKVNMTFLRDGKTLEISIPRGQISHTVDAEIMEGNIGYMSLAQFGESTGTEVREMLDQFKKEGASRLIIDLRDDGGGYLDALKDVLNCFLPADTVFILREYTDGTKEENRTSGGKYQFVDGIVLLVNDSTASASEAFTMAMKEKRDDVTIIGTKTYGKGSVQITRYFNDGSALKYTDSAWKSPSGIWVNNTGIEPDETIELHPVLSAEYKEMEEDATFGYDTVSRETEIAQMCLDFLGYESMRTDGYFDKRTEEALKEFQKKLELDETGVLDRTSYDTLISQTVYEWYTDKSHDTQLMRALELLRNRTAGAAKAEVSEAPSAAVKIDHSQIMMEETAVQAIRTDRDGII